MALRGALRRTYTWTAAHTPWSAWARRNTVFTTAAIPPALPALLGIAYVSVAPGLSPAPLLAVLGLCPLLTTLQRSRFWALLGLDVPEVVRENRWSSLRGLAERVRSEATWRQYGYHLLVSPLAAAAGALVVLAWAFGIAAASVYGWFWFLPADTRTPAGPATTTSSPSAGSCCCSPRPGSPPSSPGSTPSPRPPSSAPTGPASWSGASRTSRRAGPGCWTPPTSNAAGSNGTCTTEPSSGWSPSP